MCSRLVGTNKFKISFFNNGFVVLDGLHPLEGVYNSKLYKYILYKLGKIPKILKFFGIFQIYSTFY